MTGSEYIVRFLAEKGVTAVFGYPGSTVLPLYDALYNGETENAANNRPVVRHILARHEQGAAHMACGYARLSGRPGVCIATSGPGAANLISGIADANLDSVPMIVLTGQVERAAIGRDAFQEADIMGMTLPVTKHNYLVKTADVLPDTLEEAWSIATNGRRGPVLIDITKDSLTAEVGEPVPKTPLLPRVRKGDYPLEDAVPRILEEMESHYQPLILAGGGVAASGASGALSAFAAAAGIPVAVTMMGMGIRLSGVRPLGMAGQNGTVAARTAMDRCDLLIAAGVRFSDRTVANFERFQNSRMIVHCDIDPAEISKNVRCEIAAVCDCRAFFERLTAALPPRSGDGAAPYADWNAFLNRNRRRHDLSLPPERLSSRELMRVIDGVERELRDAVYVADVGDVLTTAAVELEPQFERGFLASGGLGVMGFAMPAAIGASFVLPDGARQIVAICGDGGFQMTMQELATLRRAACPVKLFIFDNHALGRIRKLQNRQYGGRLASSLLDDNPDFAAVARAYGIPTAVLTVDDRPQLREKLTAILTSGETTVVHCLT